MLSEEIELHAEDGAWFTLVKPLVQWQSWTASHDKKPRDVSHFSRENFLAGAAVKSFLQPHRFCSVTYAKKPFQWALEKVKKAVKEGLDWSKKHAKEIALGAVIVTADVITIATAGAAAGTGGGDGKKENQKAETKNPPLSSTPPPSHKPASEPLLSPEKREGYQNMFQESISLPQVSSTTSLSSFTITTIPSSLSLPLPSSTPYFNSYDKLKQKPFPRSFEILGKQLPRGEIGGINGMANSFKDAQQNADYLSRFAQGHQVNWVYNQTHTPVVDALEAALINSAGYSSPAQELTANWNTFHEKHLHDPSAKYLQVCHSQGALHVRNALWQSPAEIRNRVIVVALAPAAIIPKQICADSFNYAIKGDIVPKLDVNKFLYYVSLMFGRAPPILPYAVTDVQQELILIDPVPGESVHSFINKAFDDIIQKHLDNYINEYGEQQLPLEIFPGEMTSNAIFLVALLRKPHGRGLLHRTAKNLAIRRISREKIS